MPHSIAITRTIGVSVALGLAAALTTYALLSIHESMQRTSVVAASKKDEAVRELPSWAIDAGYLGDDEKEEHGADEE